MKSPRVHPSHRVALGVMISQALATSLIFLLSGAPTHQVDIEHGFYRGTATCINLQPGQCCRAIVPYLTAPGNPDVYANYPWYVEIKHLFPNQIAAVWEGRGDVEGCSGTAVRTMTAPPSRVMTLSHGNYGPGAPLRIYKFTGASYILLPKNLPPDGTTSLWLAAEGLLGLVWGGGRWFSPEATLAGTRIPRAKRKTRRSILRSGQGTAYCAEPPRWRYPDIVTINGTNFRSINTSLLEYQDADGRGANLTELAF